MAAAPETTPSPSPSPSPSLEARERGNDFYRKGNLAEAEAAYKEAAALDPSDRAPVANLSIVKFEAGHYAASIDFIRRALELSAGDEPDDSPARQKLYARLAKCCVYTARLDEAREAADKLVADADLRESVLAFLAAAEGWEALSGDVKRVFDRLPRYKPHLQDEAEYFPIGHDDADSLFDKRLAASGSADARRLAFMFCGSGDGRNVLATLFHLSGAEKVHRRPCFRDVHITMVDLKPAAMARVLILFDMFLVYGGMKAQGRPNIEDALVAMAYVFGVCALPPSVYQKLQGHIGMLVDMLGSGDGKGEIEIFNWLFLPADARRQVLRCLKQWQQPMEERYPLSEVRKAVRGRILEDEQRRRMMGDQFAADRVQHGFERDQRASEDLAVLLPPKGFTERREPQMLPFIEPYYKEAKAAAKSGKKRSETLPATRRLSEHIDATWRVNPTLVDVDYEERTREQRKGRAESDIPAFETDPVQLLERLPVPPASDARGGAMLTLGGFFGLASISLIMLAPRLKVEMLVGEMADVMERVRWGCLEARLAGPVGGVDPAGFPRVYDNIHMSNVPDYVGGLLAVGLYARPVMREEEDDNNEKPLPSDARFTVLLNPPVFASHEQFQAEYLLMPDAGRIADHFGLARRADDDEKSLLTRMKAQALGLPLFVSEGYIVWERAKNSSLSKKLPLGKLLRRAEMERWLHAHFLKLALPFPRPRFSAHPVHAPLNLTAFLRLVARLAGVGYPAHWLSGVLAEVCAGVLRATAARAPRMLVEDPAGAKRAFPRREVGVAAWAAEVSTLVSIWGSTKMLLPFGPLVKDLVAAPGDVAEYAVEFPPFPEEQQLRIPHFILVFLSAAAAAQISNDPATNLRRFLLDDETVEEHGDGSDKKKKEAAREGVHVFTTLQFATDTRRASFWCRRDVVERMMGGDGEWWAAYIYRTDTWTRVTRGVDVRGGGLVTVTNGWA